MQVYSPLERLYVREVSVRTHSESNSCHSQVSGKLDRSRGGSANPKGDAPPGPPAAGTMVEANAKGGMGAAIDSIATAS